MGDRMPLKRLTVLLAALWWGALSGISFVAVPLMFAKLGPALAGPVAAKLFSAQCWMGLGLGLALGVALEFMQGWTDYRTFDVADMAADALGVAVG